MKKLLYLILFIPCLLKSQGLVWNNGLVFTDSLLWIDGTGIVKDRNEIIKSLEISDCVLSLSSSDTDLGDLVFNSTGDTIEAISGSTIEISDTTSVSVGDYIRLTASGSGTIYRVTARSLGDSIYTLDQTPSASLDDEVFVNGNAPVYDRSYYGNNGTQTTGAYQPRLNYYNDTSSWRLDGSDDSYDITSNQQIKEFINSDFAISVWLNPVDVVNRTILRKGDIGIDLTFAIRIISENSIRIYYSLTGVDNYNESFTLTNALSVNNWNHLILTCNDRLVTLYINNDAQADTESLPSNIFEQNGPLIIGEWSGWDYVGKLDDIQIFSKALNQTEITSLYNEKVSRIKLINVQ